MRFFCSGDILKRKRKLVYFEVAKRHPDNLMVTNIPIKTTTLLALGQALCPQLLLSATDRDFVCKH